MSRKCTLPELAEMAARAHIEYTQHVCPVHRIHTLVDVKNVAMPQPTSSNEKGRARTVLPE
jgi:hypothetical protein